MMADGDMLETSEDAVLGGRLRLRQPLRGHRVGHDAILLAAATAGRAGERVIDLGAGVGAAGLALASRVPGLRVTLVEIDAALCELAAGNARFNNLSDRVDVLNADVEAVTGLTADRVLMNPPFHDATRANLSPDPRKRLAHAAEPGLLPRWVAAAARLLKPQGVLTLIWRADALAGVHDALAGVFGGIAVMPVQPRPDAEPIRVLVRAVKSGSGAPVSYPALVLNDEQGRPTVAAEAVLRGGAMLKISEI
ncbi:MAG TPA: methyltransferase [Pseudolabrys sp.]